MGMLQLRQLTYATLLCVFAAVAADSVKWGPPDNGLRMSVSLGGKAMNREIRVNFGNITEKDIFIPLGMIYGGPHPTLVRVMVKAANGDKPQVVYTGVGAVSGVVEAMTMGVRAGETYTMVLPVDMYYLLEGSGGLATFVKHPCQLWVELEITERECPNPVVLDPLRRTLSCWRGTVVSNVLQIR
jgi:hypothetical protein